MYTTTIFRYFQIQYIAGISASLTVMTIGASFVWVTPILPLLEGKDAIIPMTPTEISWMISLIEFGSLITPLISGILSDFCGRKLATLIGGPFVIGGWLLILTTKSVICLYFARILHGFGLGIVFTTVPIYMGEIAEAKVRGGLTALLQAMWYTGFLFQYFIGSTFSYHNSVRINLVLSTLVFILFYFIQPESPYYLMMKKKEVKAGKSLMALRGKTLLKDVSTELQNIQDCIAKDMKNKLKWSDAFKLSKTDFKILMIVEMLAAFRLFSGTISIATYLSDILLKADWEYIPMKYAMIIYGSTTLFVIIISMFITDLVGRRPLLLISCAGAGICNFALALFFWLDKKNQTDLSSLRWIPAMALMMYAVFFAIGLGPVTQTIQSELFPTNLRALGNIVTAYNLTISSFFCLRFYQVIVDYFGIYANFLVFCVSCIIGTIVIYIYVPETKGKTFLEISEFFSGKTETLPTKESVITKL